MIHFRFSRLNARVAGKKSVSALGSREMTNLVNGVAEYASRSSLACRIAHCHSGLARGLRRR